MQIIGVEYIEEVQVVCDTQSLHRLINAFSNKLVRGSVVV